MNPWYEKNRLNSINDWHQHVTEADKLLLEYLDVMLESSDIKNLLEIGRGGSDFSLSVIQGILFSITRSNCHRLL